MKSISQKTKYILLFISSLLFSPFSVLAAPESFSQSSGSGQITDFKSFVQLVLDQMKGLVPLFIGIAVVVFFFGIVKYVTSGQSEEKMKEGRNLMIYGLIALFVMVSVWGLVGVLTSTFFGSTLGIPQLR